MISKLKLTFVKVSWLISKILARSFSGLYKNEEFKLWLYHVYKIKYTWGKGFYFRSILTLNVIIWIRVKISRCHLSFLGEDIVHILLA